MHRGARDPARIGAATRASVGDSIVGARVLKGIERGRGFRTLGVDGGDGHERVGVNGGEVATEQPKPSSGRNFWGFIYFLFVFFLLYFRCIWGNYWARVGEYQPVGRNIRVPRVGTRIFNEKMVRAEVSKSGSRRGCLVRGLQFNACWILKIPYLKSCLFA